MRERVQKKMNEDYACVCDDGKRDDEERKKKRKINFD